MHEEEDQICPGTDQLLTPEMGLSARGGQHLDVYDRNVSSRREVPMSSCGETRRGFLGDEINVLMAGAAFNFRKWLRLFFYWLLCLRKWEGFVCPLETVRI